MISARLGALLLVPTLATLGCGSHAKPTAPDVSTALRTAVEAKAPSFTVVDDGERGHHLWQEEQRFYKQNGYQLVWSDGKRPRGQVEGLIRTLGSAGDDGLEPADYHVDELDAARKALTSAQAVDVDLRATHAYLSYAWDLSRGTIDPEDVDPQWHAAPRNVDLDNALMSGLGENNIAQ